MFNRIFSCPWAKRCAYLTAILSLIAISTSQAQVIQAPYDADYTLTDLGQVSGVPSSYGGIAFLHSDSNTLLIGGDANDSDGKLYAIQVTRDSGGHITGFTGVATVYADAPYNDGGLAYGPGNVLFYTRYSPDPGEIGQIKPGSVITDKVNVLTASFPGGLNFPPPGYPGEGKLKIADYSGGDWYSADIAPDGSGTFNIVNMVLRVSDFADGPEGFVYVPVGSPQFPNYSILLSDYGSDEVVTYQVDANGDPIAASRTLFVSGLSGAEGAVIDPVTGDFLFSTYGGGDRVIAVQGFTPPVPPPGTLTLDKTADVTTFSVAGDMINYSYLVTASGDPTPGPITVADDKVTVTCPAVNTVGNNDDNLDPGEELTCTASYEVVADDITAGFIANTATASGNAGGTVSNEDTVTVTYLAPDAPILTPQPIPALSEWSMILLSFLFLLLGVTYVRRRV